MITGKRVNRPKFGDGEIYSPEATVCLELEINSSSLNSFKTEIKSTLFTTIISFTLGDIHSQLFDARVFIFQIIN